MDMPQDVVDAPPPGVHGRTIRKNIAVVTLSYAVGSVAGFVALAYLARKLGGETFGVYVAASALVNIVGVVDQLGGGTYLVRESARDPAKMQALLGDVLVLKAGASVLVIGISVAGAIALGFRASEIVVVAILALMFGANAVSKALRAGLQSLERMEIASGISIGNAVLSAIGMVAVVAMGGGLTGAVTISTVVSIATIPVAWASLRRRVQFAFRSSLPTLKKVTRASLPFAVAGVLTVATTYADALVIKGFLGNEDVGLYGAAVRIAGVLLFAPSIYLDSVYRTISHLSRTGMAAFGAFVDRSAAWLCLASIPLAAGGTVIGGRVLTLVFGASFAPATRTLQILLWSLVFEFPSWLLMPAVTVDRPATAAKIVGGGFILNLGLNLLLVPRFGIVAAAWLTLVGGVFMAAVPTIVLARHGMVVRWPVRALPGLAVAGLMALAIYPLRHAPLAAPLAVGAVVYVGGLTLTGVPARLGLRWVVVRRFLPRRSEQPSP